MQSDTHHFYHGLQGRFQAIQSRRHMLSISWQLAITELSARDAQHHMLDHQFKGVTL
jgi:hypothetical protein